MAWCQKLPLQLGLNLSLDDLDDFGGISAAGATDGLTRERFKQKIDQLLGFAVALNHSQCGWSSDGGTWWNNFVLNFKQSSSLNANPLKSNVYTLLCPAHIRETVR